MPSGERVMKMKNAVSEMIRRIKSEKGLMFAIKVSNRYDIFSKIAGFSDYEAIFASVQSVVVSEDVVSQAESETITENILKAAGINAPKSMLKKLFSKDNVFCQQKR